MLWTDTPGASTTIRVPLPVRVGERWRVVPARHELLGLVDAIREMRRRDIEFAHAGMQPLERSCVAGW